MQLLSGRPANITGRLDKEIRTYDMLDKLGIHYERVDHEAAETIEACVEIDKVLAPATICKNLFLCNAQKNKFYLLALPGKKKFKTKDVSRQIHSSRLSFAPAEYMEQFLDITPGSVSVLGLMNDTKKQVQLIVDEDILHEEYFACHPCINTSSLRIKTENIFGKFTQAVGHDYMTVVLTNEDERVKKWD